MTDVPVYSIIIPVYNVEPYLRSCLDSLLAQRDAPLWEAVLVDDGSTDGSGAVCDEYAAGYPAFFRVLHTPNGGVSRARNRGIDAARGAYLLFLDADDLLDAGALAALAPLLDNRPDLVFYRARAFDESGPGQLYSPALSPRDGEEGEPYLRRCLNAGVLPPIGSASFSLYAASLLRGGGFRFLPGQLIAEDLDFTMQCLSHAGRVRESEYVCYYYRQRAGSATVTPSPEKQLMYSQMHAKWFREYPSTPFAELYAHQIHSYSALGSRAEVRALTAFYEENRDILNDVSGLKFRVARLLFRLFGFYGGSRVIRFLSALRRGRYIKRSC